MKRRTSTPGASGTRLRARFAPVNFIVYFDWNSVALSPGAIATIDQLRDAYIPVRLKRPIVILKAHTDSSEPNKARLCSRRLDAVRLSISQRAVPVSLISGTSVVDSEPLVPTAPGVREPQNRCVEIQLR